MTNICCVPTVCAACRGAADSAPYPSVAYPSWEGGGGNAGPDIGRLINAGAWEASRRPRRGENPHAAGLPEGWFFK